jgi:hypothetical protein
VLKQLLRLFPGDEWLPVKRQVNGKEGEWWKKLHRGTRLTFGNMTQPELSGRDLAVGDTCRYDFGSAHFVAYLLEEPDLADGGDVVAQIIVADGRRDECYLAVSKKIDERDQKRLLDEEVLEAIANQSVAARLHLRASGVVGFSPWVVETYRKQISGIRGRKALKGRERNFDYTLFVSPNNEKAIEIERFDDGTSDMYLTVYRPASDIVSILHAMRPEVDKSHPVLVKNSGVHEVEAEVAPEPVRVTGQKLADIRSQIQMTVEQEREKLRSQVKAEVVAKAQEQVQEQVKPVIQAVKTDTVVAVAEAAKAAEATVTLTFDQLKKAEQIKDDEAAKAQEMLAQAFEAPKVVAPKPVSEPVAKAPEVKASPAPVLKKPDVAVVAEQTIKPIEEATSEPVKIDMEGDAPIIVAEPAVETVASAAPVEARIDCHIRVAAKIIDEALRGDMRLEDVVRKALGLKIAQEETVSFALHLSDNEYNELAERYGCKADEKQAIHAMIVEELVDFSGERSRITAPAKRASGDTHF